MKSTTDFSPIECNASAPPDDERCATTDRERDRERRGLPVDVVRVGSQNPTARRLALAGLDAVTWTVALGVGVWLRYEGDIAQLDVAGLAQMVVVAVGAQLVLGVLTRLYRGKYCIGSADEAIHLALVATVAGGVVFSVNLLTRLPLIPRSVSVVAVAVALVVLLAPRMPQTYSTTS